MTYHLYHIIYEFIYFHCRTTFDSISTIRVWKSVIKCKAKKRKNISKGKKQEKRKKKKWLPEKKLETACEGWIYWDMNILEFCLLDININNGNKKWLFHDMSLSLLFHHHYPFTIIIINIIVIINMAIIVVITMYCYCKYHIYINVKDICVFLYLDFCKIEIDLLTHFCYKRCVPTVCLISNKEKQMNK